MGKELGVDELGEELTHRQDENLDVIYNNEKLNREEWHTFEVGKTRFNDEALRQAGTSLFTVPFSPNPCPPLFHTDTQLTHAAQPR